MTSQVGRRAGRATISVVVPNYNHIAYLGECLNAILAQERMPDEIVVVDDGSTDGSQKFLVDFAARYPIVRVLFNDTNLGAIASLNRGLAACTGEFVTFAAADDVMSPHFLKRSIEILLASPQAALVCAEVLVDQRDASAAHSRSTIRPLARPGHTRMFFAPSEVRDLLKSIDYFIVTQSALFRRALLVEAGGFDPELGSLADSFVARELALTHGFSFFPDVVVTWRVSDAGLSRSASQHPSTVTKLLDVALSRIKSRDIYPPGYDKIFERRMRAATCRLALSRSSPNWGFVESVACSTDVDRIVVAGLKRLPHQVGWTLGNLWLAIRFRAISPASVLATKLRRTFFGRQSTLNNNPGSAPNVEAWFPGRRDVDAGAVRFSRTKGT